MNKYFRAISTNVIYFLVNTVFFLAITPISIHIMGAEFFGLWSILNAIIFLTGVGTLGIGATWGKIPELYTQFNETLVTDLSPEQINHLACLLKQVPSEAVVQEQVKQEWTSAGPQAGSLLWDKTAVLNQLKALGLIP
jgi:hypothetical protein